MKKKEIKISIRTIIIAFIAGVFILLVLTMLAKKPQNLSQQYINQPIIQNAQFQTHTSQDLKISFEYPEGWYVDEKDRSILIASYYTHMGQNSIPGENQIKMFIDEFSGCHAGIEENLKDPACGEGGPSVPKNVIISKEVKQTKEGTFYKYVVGSPKGNKSIYYLLERRDKILQLSKQPDPSQFEKEFNDIIDSIIFL